MRPQRRAARSTPARAAPVPAAPVQAASGEGGGTRAALAVLSAQQALEGDQQHPGRRRAGAGRCLPQLRPWPTRSRTSSIMSPVSSRSRNGATIRGCRSAVPACRAISICAASSSTWTAFRSTLPDGYGDFQEVDPTAYRYVEVYKGGNALQFGANSLGGAINFVTPTGRDPNPNGASFDFGAFNTRRLQVNAGGANGPWDGFVTASTQASDGFRDHSFGSSNALSANVGYQISPDVETRFYLNANEVRQRIPGSVDRTTALTSPTTAAAVNVANDWQRNIDTVRIANKTTIRLDDTQLEFGAFGVDRHLMHPIFQWLDYRYKDYGGFAEADRRPHRRRFPQPVRRRRQHPQRHHRCPAVRQCRRLQGRADVVIATDAGELSGVRGEFVLLPAERRLRSPERNICSRCATSRSTSRPMATSTAAAASACGAPRPGCCGRSIRAGRCSATCRAAPRCRASARASVRTSSTRPCRTFRSSRSSRRPRRPTRSAPA